MTARLLLIAIFTTGSSAWAGALAWKPARDCRANIRNVTCRVAPQSEKQERDPRIGRPCLGGEAPYVTELQKVHDDLPPKLRQMFCHLRKIYIEEEFYATAYAARFPEVFRNEENDERVRFNGNILGLSRQKAFESKYDLSEWLNRKEQTLFGRRMEDPLAPEIPRLDMQYAGVKARPLLLDVVIHEFGHLLDDAQAAVTYQMPVDEKCFESGNSDSPDCRPRLDGVWASIGWTPEGNIRPEDRYFGDYQPCYYNCAADKILSPAQAVPLYRAFIEKSSFVSVYASVNASEDFAETFMYYISSNYFSPATSDSKYFYASVRFPGESEGVNLNSIRAQGRVNAKLSYMAMFDAAKWNYEPKFSPTTTLDIYKKKQPHLNRRDCY